MSRSFVDTRAEKKSGDRITQLETSITEIELHLQSLQGHLIAIQSHGAQEQEQENQNNNHMRDSIWYCENCGARLGVYNKERDELRVRYKDFCVYISPGIGGRTMVPCRRCGEQNALQDTRQT